MLEGMPQYMSKTDSGSKAKLDEDKTQQFLQWRVWPKKLYHSDCAIYVS